MFVQIIPAKRMPLSLPWLDYYVPEKLTDKIKIGQLVKIPFRNLEEFGVVYDIKPSLSEKKLPPPTAGGPPLTRKNKSVEEINFEKTPPS